MDVFWISGQTVHFYTLKSHPLFVLARGPRISKYKAIPGYQPEGITIPPVETGLKLKVDCIKSRNDTKM
jgi:hypothetical protein